MSLPASSWIAGVFVGLLVFYIAGWVASPAWRLPSVLGLAWFVAFVAGFLALHRASVRWTRRRPPGSGVVDAVRARMSVLPLAPIPFRARWIAIGVVALWLVQGGIAGIVLVASPSAQHALHEAARVRPEALWEILRSVLYAVAVVPVVEEFSFRGWVQGSLQHRFGSKTAVVVAAALFAVAHSFGAGRLVFPPGAFLMGILFGAAVVGSGSLWTAVLLHGAVNAAAVFMQHLADGGLLAPSGESGAAVVLLVLATAVGAVGLVVTGRMMWRARGALESIRRAGG